MATSQNGYSANDRSLVRSYVIPGTNRKVALRMGDCSVVLLDFLAKFDKEVESIDGGELDDWGYAERPIRGSSTTLSNHASGTGVDVNAPRHPLGRRNTFSDAQEKKIHELLSYYEGTIRWGGDYRTRADEMHFEINAAPGHVKRVADKIRKRGTSVSPVKAAIKKVVPSKATNVPAGKSPVLGLKNPPLYGPKVADIHRYLLKVHPGNAAKLAPDLEKQVYGAATSSVVTVFKRNRNIAEAGWGPKCWDYARRKPLP